MVYAVVIIAFLLGLCLGYAFGLWAFAKTYGNIQLLPGSKPKNPKGSAQFFEALTPEEKFNKANNIGDLL